MLSSGLPFTSSPLLHGIMQCVAWNHAVGPCLVCKVPVNIRKRTMATLFANVILTHRILCGTNIAYFITGTHDRSIEGKISS